ncbi:MAG: hypothetical protein JSU69_02705 [Candidatus Zixiibacteriota bacterium]|nr:MAG: hypothetical protein JSU69_02705 [candidate division Zixibacteria bacterium]
MDKAAQFVLCAILLSFLSTCCSISRTKRYIMRSGSEVPYIKSDYVKPATVETDEYFVTSNDNTIQSTIDTDQYLKRISEHLIEDRYSTWGDDPGFRYFLSDSISDVEYVVAIDNLGERIIVGLIIIRTSKASITRIPTRTLMVLFNNSTVGKTRHKASVFYDVYGFVNDSLAIVGRLPL